jgi:acyl-CoA thioesterase II
MMAWHRFGKSLSSPAANQAVVAWATCGEIIGLAMRPHRDQVHIQDAHRTLSTGVIGHTVHFTERFDVSEWLLIVTEATKAATGRVYGAGRIYTQGGSLVATFEQDSMARAVEGELDPKRAM